MITISTCRPEGKRNRWVARLAGKHPNFAASHMKSGDSVSYADTEELLISDLAERGFTKSNTGEWIYQTPAHLVPAVAPFVDADGIARLGPV